MMTRWGLAILSVFLISMRFHDAGSRMAPTITDGPYILYSGDKLYLNYIGEENGANSRQVDSMAIGKRQGMVVKVATDEPGKTFDVKLKSRLQVEKSEWGRPKKQLVVSDIEGNFAAFRKLLVANKVIDLNFNWTFGDGHLLLVGDFVDRGSQVTEVLWLIYSLEEKAKAAGGYVHYVLGNHEIMNLSGDLRYLHPKYMLAAQLIDKPFTELYGEGSELGRWLRTKNVIEKVGGFLYVHGGISPRVYNIGWDVALINKLARPFYSDSNYVYPNLETDILYSDYGPFWYRGFYRAGDPAVIELEVDSSMMRFNTEHIVTGHTLVADTISMWFNGKLFNTDTHHLKGHSEALLIDGRNLFRVDSEGRRFPLEPKR